MGVNSASGKPAEMPCEAQGSIDIPSTRDKTANALQGDKQPCCSQWKGTVSINDGQGKAVGRNRKRQGIRFGVQCETISGLSNSREKLQQWPTFGVAAFRLELKMMGAYPAIADLNYSNSV